MRDPRQHGVRSGALVLWRHPRRSARDRGAPAPRTAGRRLRRRGVPDFPPTHKTIHGHPLSGHPLRAPAVRPPSRLHRRRRRVARARHRWQQRHLRLAGRVRLSPRSRIRIPTGSFRSASPSRRSRPRRRTSRCSRRRSTRTSAPRESFAHLGAFDLGNRNISGGDVPERVFTALLLDDLFPVIGMRPHSAAASPREELAPNGPPVAIISHRLWQSRFGVGSAHRQPAIRIGGDRHTSSASCLRDSS